MYGDDGLKYSVTVDDSDVNYGVQGEYVVKFTVGDQTKEQKVKIYGLPTLSVGVVESFTYEQVMDKSSVDGLFANVTATDCFGESIAVGVEEGQTASSLYKQDGSVDYGQYTVTLCAVDAAGQTVSEEVTFSVVRDESIEPEITDGSFSVDVIEQSKELNLSLKNHEIITISINGVSINEQFTINEYGTVATINLADIDALELGDQNVMRIITSGGYSEIEVSLTDEADAVMDVSGRDIQTVVVGDMPAIVQPRKVYEKQNFEIELSMVDPSGESVDATGQTFFAEEMGEYILTATAKRNGEKCGEVVVKYTAHYAYNALRTEEDCSGVLGYKSVYWTNSVKQTGSVRFENKTVGDRIGDFLSVEFADASYLAFKIPTDMTIDQIEELRDMGVENVYVNLYSESKQVKRVSRSLIKVGSLDDNNTTKEESLGTAVTLEPNTWTKLTVDINDIINNYQALQDGTMLFFNIYNGGDGLDIHENFKIYFSSMLFELPPAALEIAEDEYNYLTNGRYLKGATVYRNIDTNEPKTDGITLSWVKEEVGGVLGGYAKVNIDVFYSGANGYAPSRVGVNFPIMKTLEEITALKDGGYTHLSVPMYIDCDNDKKIMGNIFTIGNDVTSVSWMTLSAKTWTTFEIPIEDIIANYADLLDGTKVLLPIVNTGDGGETNEARFNVYYGAMKFVVSEVEEPEVPDVPEQPELSNTVYNSATDLSTLIAYGYSQTTVWEGNTSGLYFGAVTEVDGKSGNFFSVHFAYDGNGIAKQYVGISIAPSVTLAQLNALKGAGYNKLSVDYYFRHQGGAMTTYKNVYTGSVYTYGQALTGAKEQKALGEWHNFTVSIDDIIANYDGLVNGTKYLMHVQNSRDEGDNAHNSTDGYGHFKAFFGNMQFIVELNTTYNACLSAEGATPTSGKADVAVGTQIGGVTGNYIRYRIWKSYVSFGIPSELTLKEIQTLKDAGYTSLQFNVYIHRVHVAGTDYTRKLCKYLGNGASKWYNVNEMHTISVSIDDIISNYDGLQTGTTALFEMNNGDNVDGPENGNNTLQVWFSNMEFVK